MPDTDPIQGLTDQALLQALTQANKDCGELSGGQYNMAAQRFSRCDREATRRWGNDASDNLTEYWTGTRASIQDMLDEADDPAQAATLALIARHGYPLGANDPSNQEPAAIARGTESTKTDPTSDALEQSFADYQAGDRVTITPNALRLFEVIRVESDALRVAPVHGEDGPQWVVSLQYVRLVRRPAPAPVLGNGDVNLLYSALSRWVAALDRQLKKAPDEHVRTEIKMYDADPDELRALMDRIKNL